MKILRLQHNVETRIVHTFVAVGVGVDYINFSDYRGIAGQDIAQLFFTEQVWFDVPLAAVSRRNYVAPNPPAPFGFRFAHPVIIHKGLKANFYTNQNVGKNDIHLLFYGYYVPNEEEIQKKPVRMIYLRGFDYDAGETSMRLPIPHAYDLLSYGFLYANKEKGMNDSVYATLPEDIIGWLQIIGKKYLFDEQQAYALRLYSDLYEGIRMLVNNFNVKRFRVDANETMALYLNSALDTDEKLYTLVEYEKLPESGMYEEDIIRKADDNLIQPTKKPITSAPYKVPKPKPTPAVPFSQRFDEIPKPGVVKEYPYNG